jgi:hypothetical protein
MHNTIEAPSWNEQIALSREDEDTACTHQVALANMEMKYISRRQNLGVHYLIPC